MTETGKGSFRGVPFLIAREQRERGGRHIAKREYPLREAGGADDIAPKIPEFTFTVCLVGKTAQQQRARLREALYAPGKGELSHPDFGTLNVLIDTFDCRYSADELDYVEFTITVIQAESSTAPEASKDTASAVSLQSKSTLDTLFDTLGDARAFASASLHDVQAVIDTVTDKIGAIESAITGLGVGHDISSFMGSLAAMRGNVSSLITTPARMAAAFAGIFSGLRAMTQFPALALKTKAGINTAERGTSNNAAARQQQAETAMQVYRTCDTLTQTLTRQDRLQVVDGVQPATVTGIRQLSQTLINATAIVRVQMASELLTAAIDRVSAQHSENVPQNGLSSSAPVADSGWSSITASLLESTGDIDVVSRDIGDTLDQCVINTSDLGQTACAMQLKRLRLALIYDMNTRGLNLPASQQLSLRRTEPALVTLYRRTGQARAWQRFVRRNGIRHPAFVPGGSQVEILDGE